MSGGSVLPLPLPQPPRTTSLPALHEQALRNGITVVVAPRHHTPLVTMVLLVRAGPEFDAPGQAGVAAMTAALLTKGAMRPAPSTAAPPPAVARWVP